VSAGGAPEGFQDGKPSSSASKWSPALGATFLLMSEDVVTSMKEGVRIVDEQAKRAEMVSTIEGAMRFGLLLFVLSSLAIQIFDDLSS
jgi:hypothetical protein